MELWTSEPGAISDYVRTADVVSEGEVREEEGGKRVYYGSTSLLFVPGSRTSMLPVGVLCARLSNDPHARLLALRIAVREATQRAGAQPGSASAEIAFREVPSGVIATVDVTLPIETAALQTA